MERRKEVRPPPTQSCSLLALFSSALDCKLERLYFGKDLFIVPHTCVHWSETAFAHPAQLLAAVSQVTLSTVWNTSKCSTCQSVSTCPRSVPGGQTCCSSASSFSSAESTHSAAHLLCVRGGVVVFSCGEEGGAAWLQCLIQHQAWTCTRGTTCTPFSLRLHKRLIQFSATSHGVSGSKTCCLTRAPVACIVRI